MMKELKMMKSLIEIKNLEKSYKNRKALNGISFDVREGEVLCVLGPNGAGKSTTINILSTALKQDSGEVLYEGHDVRKNKIKFKEKLGIVPQDLAIYEDVSAEQNVKFFTSLYGLHGRELDERADEALKFTGLYDRRKDKPSTFSGGMKRRLNIACAIAHRPKVIIMDEPTVGIDPQSRNHILGTIRKLREDGATIIYTTHYMEEVEEISTRIIIIDHGKIIAEGTKEELKENIQDEKFYRIEVDDTKKIKQNEFFRIEGVKDVKSMDKIIDITTLSGVENLDKIISFIMNSSVKINNITSSEASLETVFLNLTGRKLRD